MNAITAPTHLQTVTIEFSPTFTTEMLEFMGATRIQFMAARPLFRFSEFRQVWTAREINGRFFITFEDGRLDRAMILEFTSREDLNAYETYLKQPTAEGRWW